MDIHQHLVTDQLMLSMWPLGHHQHDRHHLVGQVSGLAGVGDDVTGATASVHSDMAWDDLEHIGVPDKISEIDNSGYGGTLL